MTRTSSDQRFQAALPLGLMAAAVVVFILAAMGAGAILYALASVLLGVGLVLEVRRHNKSPLLTGALIVLLLAAYWVIGTEVLKATWVSH